MFRGEFGSTTEDPLPRERTVQALALGGTASAVGRLVVNVLTIVSTMNMKSSAGIFESSRSSGLADERDECWPGQCESEARPPIFHRAATAEVLLAEQLLQAGGGMQHVHEMSEAPLGRRLRRMRCIEGSSGSASTSTASSSQRREPQ